MEVDDRSINKLRTYIGEARHGALSIATGPALEDIGQRMVRTGVELLERAELEGMEPGLIEIPEREPKAAGKEAELGRLLRHRNNDISRLKAVIGGYKDIVAALKEKNRLLRLERRELYKRLGEEPPSRPRSEEQARKQGAGVHD